MTKPGTIKRWHHWVDGVRVIRCFPVGVDPNTLGGACDWLPGNGARTQQELEQYKLHAHKLRGPKTQQHREAMSKAALGVPKSLQHRASMRAAHRQRADDIKQIQQQHPELDYSQCCALYRARKEINKQGKE